MREIKFRAWSKIEGKMKYYDRDCSSPNMTLNGVLIDGYSSNVSYQYELMQYTGLKDKNGKEIYEGDIVRHCEGDGWVVEWEISEAVGYAWSGFPGFCKSEWSKIEVIGNVHENKELLE